MSFSLREIADILESATRQGMSTDQPEGSRYITLSDTLAKQMAAALRQIAKGESARAVPLERR